MKEFGEATSKIVCDPDCHPESYESPWGWDALWDALVFLAQSAIVCAVGLVIGALFALCTPRKTRP